jgi:hypothetical protein
VIDVAREGFGVLVRVRVLAQRPSDDYGELHGLYEPGDARAGAYHWIAPRRKSRSWRSFIPHAGPRVRPPCHYEYFKLPEPSTPKASTSAVEPRQRALATLETPGIEIG